jgi:hypothetical protein
MSLEVDGTWKAGVWESTVWADGVWAEGITTPVEPPAPTQSYVGRKRRVDDLTREDVVSAYELVALRKKAREVAIAPPALEPVVAVPKPHQQSEAPPVVARAPDAQPSRVVIHEGAAESQARRRALLFALSELVD